MNPSHEEIEAGQKSYQRLKSFNRYKATVSTWVIITLFVGFLDYSSFHDGHRISAIFWTLYLLAAGFQHWRRKVRCDKDYESLEQLKLKYGRGVYTQIEKEPDSLFYKVFQKLYWPDSRRKISFSLP
jgi:hypothetical protein